MTDIPETNHGTGIQTSPETAETLTFTLEEGQSGRADKVLCTLLDISRNRSRELIEQGRVLLQDTQVKPKTDLKPGQTITVHIPPEQSLDVLPEDMDLDIVYEDSDIIVINKPSGLVVHPAPGHVTGTLVNGLLAHCTDLSGINGVMRPGIVHRIDKDTSGLLVVAKTPEAKMGLGVQFFNKTTHRSYVALVWGNFTEDSGTIEGNIARDPKDRMRMTVFPPDSDIGKSAVTHYRVIERFGYVTLVECILETGRTHQIRAHMRHIGHPLFSDQRYGGTEILRGERTGSYRQFVLNCFAYCPRQALHARTLGFVHPTTKEQMDFTSDLPADLWALIEKWRRYVSARMPKEDLPQARG